VKDSKTLAELSGSQQLLSKGPQLLSRGNKLGADRIIRLEFPERLGFKNIKIKFKPKDRKNRKGNPDSPKNKKKGIVRAPLPLTIP
jgi:hypothetical protein